MMTIVGWFLANWQGLLGCLLAFCALGTAVAKLTPTPKDDSFFAKVTSFLARLGFAQHSDVGGLKAPLVAPRKPGESLIVERHDLPK